MHSTNSLPHVTSAVLFSLFVGALLWLPVVQSAEPDYSEEDHILVGLEAVYESGLYHGQDGYVYPDF